MTHRPEHRRGSATLEFALILPIWIALVLAIVEFGWVFYRTAALDTAANEGCRAGSLLDPGEDDANLAAVEARATARMREVLVQLGDEECLGCEVEAATSGAPPNRVLVCRVRRPFTPLVGLYLGPTVLHTLQVARLEWQREAAP